MFDEIGADLRQAGHRITRYAHRDAFTATPDPLTGIDVLLCVAVFPLTRAMLAAAPRLRAIVSAVTGVDGVDVAAATEHGGHRQRADRGEHHRHGRGDGADDARRALRSRWRAGSGPAEPVASAAAQGEPASRQDHRPDRARQDRPRDRAPAGAVGRDPAVQRAPRCRPHRPAADAAGRSRHACCERATSSWCWRASIPKRAGSSAPRSSG